MTKPRIGVLTSGGDCPGLNAVLRGVVLAAEKLGWEVLGFLDGFEGLLPPGNYKILKRRDTALRKEDEDVDIVTVAEGLDGGAAGVA